MIFFKRQKYKLPNFPPNAKQNFIRYCECISLEKLNSLKDSLIESYSRLNKNADTNDFIDKKALVALYERALFLIDSYDSFDERQQALVVGAIRYFILDDDGIDDEVFATGFADDIKIMNYVLQEIGIEDQFIEDY
jgi:uncharacterized membrane protein YkvA (DUF1232 family)